MGDGITETAWGRWVRKQPRGVLTDAQMATGFAYATIHAARTRRVSRELAEALSAFTLGAVKVEDMAKPSRKRAVASRAARRRRRALRKAS